MNTLFIDGSESETSKYKGKPVLLFKTVTMNLKNQNSLILQYENMDEMGVMS
jgi:hypothetical protein